MEKTATLREVMALAATEPAGPRLRRRRGTLRSLLFRRFRRRGGDPSDRARDTLPASTGGKYRLEDLFLLHPPLDGPASERIAEARRHSSLEAEAVGGGLAVRRSGSRRLPPVAGSFRCRMLRRAWRPVLLTIPE
ncbi:uncharacterized protein LOC130136722 [Syzygium oleosum]|uniref:uncharacterized protein LOC130136722 n=1 Tax=Syzygium oleosum TaxID=219896 RepID=UPI0024B9D83A|nr:uncharacterized protein LOC130136722 [Syzygium oleosum]